MNDNMNNYTALFDGCSLKTEEVESLGVHTFVSADFGQKRIVIESPDIGGIGSFVGDPDKFFIIKYMGRMPKITYQYHFNDTELDTIFEIDPSGDNFGKLTFSPLDDLSAGSAIKPLDLSSFDEYASNVLHGKDNSVVSSIFAVCSYIGITAEDGHYGDSYIGIDVYSRGGKVQVSKTLGEGLVLGGMSKRIVITLDDTTKLESFSMGTHKMIDATKENEEEISRKVAIAEMLDDPIYSEYHENIRKFQKMLEYPNKMFDTNSQL